MPTKRIMTASELRRKTNKPIMEKKRRQRINKCLEDLKKIMIKHSAESMRPNKLEKADILEMTVHYLNNVLLEKKLPLPVTELKQQLTEVTISAMKSPDAYLIARQKGYAQCAKDADVFLKMENVSNRTRNHLLSHLSCQLLGQKVEVREIDQEARTEVQRLEQSAYAFVKDSSATHSLLFSKQHGVKIVSCDAHPESSKSRTASSRLLVVKPKDHIFLASQLLSENRDWNDMKNDSDFLKIRESKLYSPFSDSVSVSKRHCSSNDSGNWSSGSRPCSPSEVGTPENCNNIMSSPISRLQMSTANLKEKVWRPWEFK